jgi:hypothetical protein
MGRCVYCHSVVTKEEDHCYVCGDTVPPYIKGAVKRRPVSGWTNTIFLASLGFLGYRFFAEHKLSLPVTLAISSALLLLRLVAEWFANRKSN